MVILKYSHTVTSIDYINDFQFHWADSMGYRETEDGLLEMLPSQRDDDLQTLVLKNNEGNYCFYTLGIIL